MVCSRLSRSRRSSVVAIRSGGPGSSVASSGRSGRLWKQGLPKTNISDTLFTDVFKIYGPIFQNIWPARYCVQNTLHGVWGRQEGVNDDNVDITTGVTTRFPRGVDGDHAEYDGIRPATQVGRRWVGGGSRGV